MNNSKVKEIAFVGVMLGLAVVLSIFPKIVAPFGGAVTVGSMVPIMMVCFVLGKKWGIAVSVGFSVIELLLDFSMLAAWGVSPTVFVGSCIFDYILAFSSISLCGVWGSNRLYKTVLGAFTACFARYLCHFISGWILFGMWAGEGYSPFTWSIVYNGAYMLPEALICCVIVAALYPFTKQFYKN